MKAIDLMIGDYCLVKPSMMPIKVAAIHQKKVAYHAVTNKLNWVRESLLEPIRLNLEHFEKIGFKVDGYAILTLDENSWLEYYHYEHRLRRYWSGIDEWQNHSKVKDITFQCHCYYFHELQQALRMCYIKKEIEL